MPKAKRKTHFGGSNDNEKSTNQTSTVTLAEEALEKCQEGRSWRCPLSSCSKLLSRKQTLKSHIMTSHQLQCEKVPGRYKMYEVDDSLPVPRSTYYMKMGCVKTLTEEDHGQTVELGGAVELGALGASVGLEAKEIEVSEEHVAALEQLAQAEITAGSLEITNEEVLCSTDMELSSGEESESCYDTDSEEERSDLENDSSNDPPLYVIDSKSRLWHSSIKKSEHELAVGALACRHNLSDTCIKDVLSLLQIHLPPQNLGETNVKKIKELCGFKDSSLKQHEYCEYCKKLFGEINECQTPDCKGAKSDAKCKKYFLTSSLKLQVKEILEREGIWQAVQETKLRDVSESLHLLDVTSGQVYKELLKPGGFLHNTDNITFSLFTDGVPIFKSSGVSIWPVYLLINEIPAKERFLRKNLLLWGVWQGVGKPNMNMFFKPLVVELMDLYQYGIPLLVQEELVTVKAMLLLVTMDLQARAGVLSMTQHNGMYGCLYCLEPGISVASGKGHCHVYPVREQPAEIRTNEMVRDSAKKARTESKRIDGFFGESVLLYLPYFSLIDNVVIDYMHGILIGVTKAFLVLWFDEKYLHEPFNITGHITNIDKQLKDIHPPYMIHRHPRILSKTFQHWKASELRNWLLFYSLPCLQGYLPQVYLIHFSCLVEGTYILLGDCISQQDLCRAELLLKKFVDNVSRLYPMRVMGINVHNLTHLVQCVRLHGPLWGFSCFAFESFNGELKRSIHGTGNICKQLFWGLQAQKQVEQKATVVRDGETKQFLKGMVGEISGLLNRSKAYQCEVGKLKPFTIDLSDEDKENFVSILGAFESTEFMMSTKIYRNGFAMYSSRTKKVKKQNSYTILLESSSLESATAMEVQFYAVKKESRKVLAVGKLLHSTRFILPSRVPHMKRFECSRQGLAVIKAELLREPLVVVKREDTIFAGCLPNHFERD